ncbi:MAG TPA: hypothetical protein VGG57_09475 [Stellaceae bacterium]
MAFSATLSNPPRRRRSPLVPFDGINRLGCYEEDIVAVAEPIATLEPIAEAATAEATE